MSIKTRLDKLENRATTAVNQAPLVLWPVEGKPGFYGNIGGHEYEYGGPDWPTDKTVIRVEYDRGKHEQF